MIDQIAIFALGITAITCTNMRSPKIRRWAPIAGLISEPFWLYTAIKHTQWGIAAMAFIYMAMWGYGVYIHWFSKVTPR